MTNPIVLSDRAEDARTALEACAFEVQTMLGATNDEMAAAFAVLALVSASVLEVTPPFERVPVCACDPGTGDPPSRLKRLECRARGGHCAGQSGPDEPASFEGDSE